MLGRLSAAVEGVKENLGSGVVRTSLTLRRNDATNAARVCIQMTGFCFRFAFRCVVAALREIGFKPLVEFVQPFAWF
jgi:hypothetical protein